MPKILFNNHLVNEAELKKHHNLLQEIASRGINSKQVKKLTGVTYTSQKLEVFRAKINSKKRIVFTYIKDKKDENKKTLMILSILEDHNYKRLKGQLSGVDHYMEKYQQDDDNEDTDRALDSKQEKTPEKEDLTLNYTPVTCYNDMHLELDDAQNNALKLATPLLMLGPPGSGKTAVLYTLLLKYLKQTQIQQQKTAGSATAAVTAAAPIPIATAVPIPVATAAPLSVATATAAAPIAPTDQATVLFVSPSKQLIKNLKQTYDQVSEVPVLFSTWEELLQKHYPNYTLIKETVFAEHYQSLFLGEDPRRVHYELSLLAALKEDKYRALALRQSHFSKDKTKQDMVVKLLTQWQHYLDSHKLIDPLTTMLPTAAKKYTIFCDETQNLPPTALRSLIQHTSDKQFVACLDSEQCMATSPFIHNCLKELLGQQGKYVEHPLERTWRCPPAVVDVANHLMNAKYEMDQETRNKRLYNTIKSTQETPGLVSWVDEKNYPKLAAYGELPTTVIIVPQEADLAMRALIKKQFNCLNVMTAEQAIGLDFSVVILWKPLSQGPLAPLARKQKFGTKLSTEQWYGLNSLYVAATRTQAALFICEEEQQTPRMQELAKKLLGTIPKNQFDVVIEQTSVTEQNQQREILIQHYLDRGEVADLTIASELMGQLGLSQEALKKRRAEIRTLSSEPTEQDRKSNSLPKNTLGEPKPLAKRKTALTASATLAPEATKTKSKPGKKGATFTEYVTGLLANPTEKSLTNLFKDPNANKLLFKTPKGDDCLFFKLIKKGIMFHLPESKNIIPSFVEHITAAFISEPNPAPNRNSVLEYFTKTTEGLLFLDQMLRRKPDFAKIINKPLLCNPDCFGISPFYGLIEKGSSRLEALILLLNNNPDLTKEINGKDLCTSPPPNPETVLCANRSPLFLLSMSDRGIELLISLLGKNPGLVKEITAEALCLPLPLKEIYQSPLYYLAGNTAGLRLLTLYIDGNPQLAKGITAEALSQAQPLAAGEYANQSVLSNLMALKEGRVILFKLIEANPDLIQTITPEAVCRARTKEAGAAAGYSPLYGMVVTPEGQYILMKLLSRDSNFARGITATALCLEVSSPHGHQICVLFELLTTPLGLIILEDLLKKTPDLARQIHSLKLQTFCRTNIQAKALLARDPIGIEVYKKINEGQYNAMGVSSGTLKLISDLTSQSIFSPPEPKGIPQTAASIMDASYDNKK